MAKEVAISKRIKISKAQEYMILAVLGASVVLGGAVSAIVHFVQQIAFNTEVIMAEEKSIADYSNLIKSAGVCKKPSGDVYTEEELKKCKPDEIELSEIPGTLRSKILVDLAANPALNSVPKIDSSSECRNQIGEQYTYDDLMNMYKRANGTDALATAAQRIRNCSALRVIPDALPAFKNEEALLASLNKLFVVSGWQPESLSPGSSGGSVKNNPSLHEISVSLSIEADASVTNSVLDNIERSIREFDIKRASIEWKNDNALSLQAQAAAYYMDESKISETTTTIKADGGKK